MGFKVLNKNIVESYGIKFLIILLFRTRNLQCQRIFQTNAPITSICLHPNQGELILGDQSGLLHLWDLKTDHNEQLVCLKKREFCKYNFLLGFLFFF